MTHCSHTHNEGTYKSSAAAKNTLRRTPSVGARSSRDMGESVSADKGLSGKSEEAPASAHSRGVTATCMTLMSHIDCSLLDFPPLRSKAYLPPPLHTQHTPSIPAPRRLPRVSQSRTDLTWLLCGLDEGRGGDNRSHNRQPTKNGPSAVTSVGGAQLCNPSSPHVTTVARTWSKAMGPRSMPASVCQNVRTEGGL